MVNERLFLLVIIYYPDTAKVIGWDLGKDDSQTMGKGDQRQKKNFLNDL